MFLNSGVVNAVDTPDPVQLPAILLGNNSLSGPVYSGIRFDSDGKIYEMSAGGTWQYAADWLLSGAASDYYLFRTIDSGTLTNDDGDGTQMNTADIDFWISSNVNWFVRQTRVTFNICSDTLGAVVLATRQYLLSAEKEGTGSPP